MIRYLTVEEVVSINERVILKYNDKEDVGVKSLPLLESAVCRPMQSLFGEDAYPSIFDKATALFESIGKNHAFQNGNKRTAFACLVIFLFSNDIKLEMNQEYAVHFTVNMVKGSLSFEEVSKLIELHSKYQD